MWVDLNLFLFLQRFLVGNVVGLFSKVIQRRAWLVIGWVIVSRPVSHLCM